MDTKLLHLPGDQLEHVMGFCVDVIAGDITIRRVLRLSTTNPAVQFKRAGSKVWQCLEEAHSKAFFDERPETAYEIEFDTALEAGVIRFMLSLQPVKRGG